MQTDPPPKSPQKPCNPPRFIHVFAHEKAMFLRIRAQGIHPENLSQTPNNQKLTTAHHNSPQNPKIIFIHSQLA
jgi:hypothetical protein